MSINLNSELSKSVSPATDNTRVEVERGAPTLSGKLGTPYSSVDVPLEYAVFEGDDAVEKLEDGEDSDKIVEARQQGGAGNDSMSDSQNGKSNTPDLAAIDQSSFDPDTWIEALANSPNAMILMIEIINMMKFTMREQQRTESIIRMEKYTATLDMAFQKHDHIKEAAIKIKELKDEAADMKFNMGITKMATSFLGSNSGLASGAFEMWGAKIEEVMNQAEKVQMDHQAQVALEDGLMSNYDKQASLANSQFMALEDILKNIMSSVSQLQQIDDRGRSGIVRTMA